MTAVLLIPHGQRFCGGLFVDQASSSPVVKLLWGLTFYLQAFPKINSGREEPTLAGL
jgi:hypothetical protein